MGAPVVLYRFPNLVLRRFPYLGSWLSRYVLAYDFLQVEKSWTVFDGMDVHKASSAAWCFALESLRQ